MKVTLYRNNPQAANGMMSQETLECDEVRIISSDQPDSVVAVPLNRTRLLIFPPHFTAILVDNAEKP